MAETSPSGASAGAPTGNLPDGVATAEMFASGEASAVELLDEATARAERLNPQINAVIGRLDDSARRTAEQLDASRSASAADAAAAWAGGSLAGVPFLTKDLTCTTEGQPYHAGNVALRDAGHVAASTAHLATMFAELGLVNFGRTNTPEFGLTVTTEPLAYGPTANPWNAGHSAGGSSGGSAAAVAAGIVPIAHANDGGGSIRVPAANCGLFGLKPNRGRVSLGPASGDGWAGFSVDGVVSRSVRDSARVLDGISRPWPGDPYWAPPPSGTLESAAARPPGVLRIGLAMHSDWGPVHPECMSAVDDAGRLAESLGHAVEYSAPDGLFDEEFFEHFRTVVSACNAVELAIAGGGAGPASDTRRHRGRHMGVHGDGARRDRRAVHRGHRVVPRLDAPAGAVVGFARRAGVADHDRAAAAPGRAAQPRDRPGPAQRAAPLHPAVERDGAAGHVGTAALDCRRAAGGRAVRGPPRQRGDAAVTGRPAGAGSAVGRPHPAAVGRYRLRG